MAKLGDGVKINDKWIGWIQFLPKDSPVLSGLPPQKDENNEQVAVQCFPLYSILLAINRTRVDFFSLDIDGYELQVLQTVPFHRLDIRV